MKFFDRWKKRSFEEKMDDLSQTVLTENNIKDPKQVEMALWKSLPPEERNDLCHRLVNHGREVCTARTKPYCDRCCLNDICDKNGI